jgi:sister-chromatid-cohesion protein PDS5
MLQPQKSSELAFFATSRSFLWLPRHVAEQVLADYIFPLPSTSSNGKGGEVDEVAWTERLLLTMKFLDDKAITSLLNLSGLKRM